MIYKVSYIDLNFVCAKLTLNRLGGAPPTPISLLALSFLTLSPCLTLNDLLLKKNFAHLYSEEH